MIVLLGAVLYAVLFVWSPAAALLTYVATRPAIEAVVFVDVGPVSVGQLWGAGLLVALTAFIVVTPIRPATGRGIPRPIVALIALYAFLAARGDTAIALQYGPKLVGWLLLVVAVERIARTPSGQMSCFKAGYALAVGTAVIIGVLAVTGHYGAAHYTSLGAGLEGGNQQDPQALGFLALFCMPFPLIALLQRWLLFPSLVVVGALTVEIVLSFVRAALVGAVLMLLVYIFVAARRRRTTAFALAGAFAVTAYVVQGRLADRFADINLLFSGEASRAGSGRVAIWTSVWETTTGSIQTAAAGGGAGTSQAASLRAIGAVVDAHNDYLEFFATGGLLLVGAYAIVVVGVIGSVVRVYRDPAQSTRVRTVAAMSFGVIAAFISVSLLATISFYVATMGFALLLGLIRGMSTTPAMTCFDPGSAVARRA
jgi:hypothetical protein